jgi:hypothetical protein
MSSHAIDDWYPIPVLHHYRCYRVWVWATSADHITDALTRLPTNTGMSFKSSADAGISDVIDLTNALYIPSPASPIYPVSDSQRARLRQPTCPSPTANVPISYNWRTFSASKRKRCQCHPSNHQPRPHLTLSLHLSNMYCQLQLCPPLPFPVSSLPRYHFREWYYTSFLMSYLPRYRFQ